MKWVYLFAFWTPRDINYTSRKYQLWTQYMVTRLWDKQSTFACKNPYQNIEIYFNSVQKYASHLFFETWTLIWETIMDQEERSVINHPCFDIKIFQGERTQTWTCKHNVATGCCASSCLTMYRRVWRHWTFMVVLVQCRVVGRRSSVNYYLKVRPMFYVALKVTGGFPSQGASNAELWCQPETFDWPVIWDAMTFVWCHCDASRRTCQFLCRSTAPYSLEWAKPMS